MRLKYDLLFITNGIILAGVFLIGGKIGIKTLLGMTIPLGITFLLLTYLFIKQSNEELNEETKKLPWKKRKKKNSKNT